MEIKKQIIERKIEMELNELREIMKIKAMTFYNEIVTGYYYRSHFEDFVKTDDGDRKISPYDICRNTGIKDKDGNYVYEYDLIEYKELGDEKCGYAVWSETKQRYVIRDYIKIGGGEKDFDEYLFKVAGNILLSNDDYERVIANQKQ